MHHVSHAWELSPHHIQAQVLLRRAPRRNLHRASARRAASKHAVDAAEDAAICNGGSRSRERREGGRREERGASTQAPIAKTPGERRKANTTSGRRTAARKDGGGKASTRHKNYRKHENKNKNVEAVVIRGDAAKNGEGDNTLSAVVGIFEVILEIHWSSTFFNTSFLLGAARCDHRL